MKKIKAIILTVLLILSITVGCDVKDESEKENILIPKNNQTEENLSTEEEADKPLKEPEIIIINGCEFEYEITDNWAGGFEARVRIINMTSVAVDGWKLFFNGDFIITEIQNAKLISSEDGNHVVINEFWTKAINPHSSAIFTFTAEKQADAEITLDGFILSENDIPEEPAPALELSTANLRGFSELGYNVLLWDFDHNVESYTIFKNGEEIAAVNNVNFYFDKNVEENETYEYYIVQTLNGLSEESGKVSVTVSSDEPEGVSAREILNNLRSDFRETKIEYQEGDSSNYISKDLTLVVESEKGSIINWLSSNENILNSHGVVTRPTGGFFPITLTAVLQNDEYMQSKTFGVNVAPYNNVMQKEMTMEDLEELNKDGEMPRVVDNNGKKITIIEDSGKRSDPKNNISPFPIFGVEEAQALIDSYYNMFGFNEYDIDIRFVKCQQRGPENNEFFFEQYYNNIRVENRGVTIFTQQETGRVIEIINNCYINEYIETTPQISIEEAKQIALSTYDVEITGEPELFISSRNNTGIKVLAWYIPAVGEVGDIEINAHSGEVFSAVTNPS